MVGRHSILALAAALPALAQYYDTPTSSAACATLSAKYARPSVATGFQAILVAQNLTKPRSIHFTPNGRLLVVESGLGITSYAINGTGSCLRASDKTVVVADSSLNHGIELSTGNSSYLYASNSNNLYRWAFDVSSTTNTSEPELLVTNMSGDDHTTRTLLLSKKNPGYIIISRGSTSNLDYESSDLGSGHSQVKAFRIPEMSGGYPEEYVSGGTLLGWGLRNEVGLDEHPQTGNIFGVENSADQITRDGTDVHQDNPGEELNFLGNLANASSYEASGRNFGYPECFAAWSPSSIPNFNGTVGQQFTIGTSNSTNNDTICSGRVAPRLTFQAHMAPLDILFNPNGTVAWITFHGSWNRDVPSGYKLGMVEFDAATGQPVQSSSSTSALINIMTNANNSACPSGCFRPVGLAWDNQGRLFMTSDATGEIYAIVRSDNSTSTAGSNATGTVGLPSSNTTTGGPSSSTTGAAIMNTAGSGMLAMFFAALAFLL